MDELNKKTPVGVAALRAGMHRNTARRYVQEGKLPSELKAPRQWRTREDPFAEDWPEVEGRLEAAPELEAKALFEDLVERNPGRYQEGQLRTFQRRVKQWRAEHGPDKELMLPQSHRPGEALQTDFTWANSLGIRVDGRPFDHMLCQTVLPYSNWQSVSVCQSESMLALRNGIQKAVFLLGRVPEWHQTDNSTAATHELGNGKRSFNVEYGELMARLGMKPRTIAIGESRQNGDVEALNGALKRRLEQHLLLRGSRDFESPVAYEQWLDGVLERANALRTDRLTEELARMRPVTSARLPRYRELRVRVTSNGTISVQKNTYSVPARLRGERVLVRLFEMHLEVWYGASCQLKIERLRGEGNHRIQYRHVIGSLVKKPWGFRRYRWREDLLPTQTFRRAYQALQEHLSERQADLEYLRVLQLAAMTMQCEVEEVIDGLLREDRVPVFDAVEALMQRQQPEIPEMEPLAVDLTSYDELLGVEVYA